MATKTTKKSPGKKPRLQEIYGDRREFMLPHEMFPEFEDVSILVYNAASATAAKRKLNDFLAFIRRTH